MSGCSALPANDGRKLKETVQERSSAFDGRYCGLKVDVKDTNDG